MGAVLSLLRMTERSEPGTAHRSKRCLNLRRWLFLECNSRAGNTHAIATLANLAEERYPFCN
jgi:hypothetical protein